MNRTTHRVPSADCAKLSALASFAPEGNFRVNEPSPHANLAALSLVKILWVDELQTLQSTVHSDSSSSCLPCGLGLRARILFELNRYCVVPLRDLVDAFPVASEYYREHGSLRLHIEEAPLDASTVLTSRWENVFAAKRYAVVLTMIRSFDSSNPSDFGRRLSEVKTLLQQTKFASSLRRCIVFDPPAQYASSLEMDMFLVVKSSTPIAEVARALMHDIGADVVHHITSRVLALSLSTSYNEAIGSFKTPIDKIDFAEGSLDSKSELSKVIRCRAAKRRGDLLLQLEAPDAALMAYGELAIGSSDSLWVAAHLESVASARYIEGQPLVRLSESVKSLLADIQVQRYNPNDEAMVQVVNQIESEVRNTATRLRKASLALGQSLPQLTKQRLTKEIEEPLLQRVEKLAAVAHSLRSTTATASAQQPSPYAGPLSALAMLPTDAAGQLLKELYDDAASLWYSELELYLVEAYHYYRTLQPRLFELEAELYLKLAWIRAEQRNTRKLLEVIADLNKTLKFVSPEAAQRVGRTLGDLCVACGCKRKGVFYAIESALKDKRSENYYFALSSLFKAAAWSDIPLSLDDVSGHLKFTAGSALQQQQSLPLSGSSSTAAGGMSSKAMWSDSDFHNTGGILKVPNPAKSHISILFEMMDVLSLGRTTLGYPALRCQLASAALFLYGDLMDKVVQDNLLSAIQMESASIPPLHAASVVPPPLLVVMQPQPLPAHLSPQLVSMGGAQFTYIDRERMRMTVVALGGKRLSHSVVWTVGEPAHVEVVLSNPFDVVIQLTTVTLSVEALPDDEVVHETVVECTSAVGEDKVTCYVLHGFMMSPRSTVTARLYLVPHAAGTVRLQGLNVVIGQVQTSLLLPMLPVIEVPVVKKLPQIECFFPGVSEVELFAGQSVPLRCHIVNSGDLPVLHLGVSVHSSTCQLMSCEGCRERQPSATSNDSSDVAVSVSRLILRDALPLGPGEVIPIDCLITALSAYAACSFDHLVFRVDYYSDGSPPQAPAGVPPSVPVFAVVPRKILESRLRLHTVPSLVITDVSLSRDRRFVEVRVRNNSPRHTIELLLTGAEPFDNVSANATFLAGTELILPLIEISRLPDRKDCVFRVPWVVLSRTAKGPPSHSSPSGSATHKGFLVFDLVDTVKDVYSTEPLEDLVVVATFEELCHHFDTEILSPGMVQAKRLSHSQNWISVAPSRLPVSLPAVTPVLVRLCINAPWTIDVPVTVTIDFEFNGCGDDVGMISGPVRKRSLVGRDGAACYDEEFEISVFKTGEHFLRIVCADDRGRLIAHDIRLQVEHAVDEQRFCEV